MANDSGGQTWRRYRRPGDPRDEEGRTSSAKKPTPKPTKPSTPSTSKASSGKQSSSKPSSSKSGPSVADSKAVSSMTKRAGVFAGAGVLLALVVGGIVGAVRGGDGGSDEPEVDTTYLQADTLSGVLAEAEEAHEGIPGSPLSVRIGESSVDIEYFDPNADELWTYSSADYLDGYSIRVERNADVDRYGRPRPLDLDAIDPAAVESAAEQVLAEADDPDYFTATIMADSESGEVRYDISVSDGDDYLDVTTDAEGNVISEDS